MDSKNLMDFKGSQRINLKQDVQIKMEFMKQENPIKMELVKQEPPQVFEFVPVECEPCDREENLNQMLNCIIVNEDPLIKKELVKHEQSQVHCINGSEDPFTKPYVFKQEQTQELEFVAVKEELLYEGKPLQQDIFAREKHSDDVKFQERALGVMNVHMNEDSEFETRHKKLNTSTVTTNVCDIQNSQTFECNLALKQNLPETFRCDFCLAVFPTKHSIIMHVFTHIDGVQPPRHVCFWCGEVLPTQGLLNGHLFRCSQRQNATFKVSCGCVISNETSHYICEFCGKCFKRFSKLQNHSMVHSREKPYSCDICGKRYRYPSSVQTHIRVHYDGQHFQCQICGIKCISSTAMVRHYRTHRRKAIPL